AVAEERSVARREGLHERVEPGDSGRREHGLLRDRCIAEREVVVDRPREQLDDLRHHAEKLSALCLCERRGIAVSYPDRARPRRIETREELKGAGLPGA